ncbi:fibronectin type III domain-containing protein [Peribacillus deserti]|uniref:SbsC C-terminal domain-containing protein n=1 Tax=Peribacillus deserti TaxID=673318 RepID=A0A2N5MBS9_9BACI|nr:fibronectin type III domain-containing protein [Peribacillus deserti]PLT31765.1 hypothetical protein CUU66_00975 [Peribacillus deserti]
MRITLPEQKVMEFIVKMYHKIKKCGINKIWIYFPLGEGFGVLMSLKRKRFKTSKMILLTTAAVTGVVATIQPVSGEAALTSRANELTKKAETLAKSLKNEITYSNRAKKYPKSVFDYPNSKLLKDTEIALKNAKKAAASSKGKERQVLEARLNQNVKAVYDRAIKYRDAVKSGKTIEIKTKAVKYQLDKGVVDNSLSIKNKVLTDDLKKYSSAFTKVSEKAMRDGLIKFYQNPAKSIKDTADLALLISKEQTTFAAVLKAKNIDKSMYYFNRVGQLLADGKKTHKLKDGTKLYTNLNKKYSDLKATYNTFILQAASSTKGKPTLYGGSVNKVKTYDTLVIIAGKNKFVRLSNAVVNGNIVIKGDKTGSGTVYLENVKVNKVKGTGGSIIVEDVAEHSLYQNKVTAEELRITDTNGANIVSGSGTTINSVIVTEKAGSTGSINLEAQDKGNYGEIEIASTGSQKSEGTILKGNFSETTVSITGNGTEVTFASNSEVKEVNVTSAATLSAQLGASVQTVNLAAKTKGQDISLNGDLDDTLVKIANPNAKIHVGKNTEIKKVEKDENITDSIVIENQGNIKVADGVQVIGNPVQPTIPSTTDGVFTPPVIDNIAPIAYVVNDHPQKIFNFGENVIGQSNELGILYVVDSTESPNNKAALDELVLSGRARKAPVTAANTDVEIDVSGLPVKTYKLYSVDLTGNISIPSEELTIGPLEPTNLHIDSIDTNYSTEGSVKNIINWTASVTPGVIRYSIHRNTTNSIENSTHIGTTDFSHNSFEDTSAVPGTTYYYFVFADSGYSGKANPIGTRIDTAEDLSISNILLESGSIGEAGNKKITGLTSGRKYAVTTDGKTYGVQSNGTLGEANSAAEELSGTEITGLLNGRTYFVSEEQQSSDGNPPIINMDHFGVTNITDSSLDFKVKVNENAIVYYVLVPDSEVVPPPHFVKDGKNALNVTAYKHGSFPLSANTQNTSTINGLTAGTKYKLVLLVEDLFGNSTTLHVFSPTTLGNQNAPSIVRLAGGSLGIAGNQKISGLTVGKKYKIEVNGTTYGVQSDGYLGAPNSEPQTMGGDEIKGLINGVEYRVTEEVNVPTPSTAPTPSDIEITNYTTLNNPYDWMDIYEVPSGATVKVYDSAENGKLLATGTNNEDYSSTIQLKIQPELNSSNTHIYVSITEANKLESERIRKMVPVGFLGAIVSKGSVAGSTRVIADVAEGNRLMVKVSSSRIELPVPGDSVPDDAIPYTSGDNILGVDPENNHVLGYYEVDENNKVVNFGWYMLGTFEINNEG